MIPEDRIAAIRRAADIVEIVAETVTLRKAGKNLVGLCPFHAEKTPSFTVSPDKQIFHCFGCGAGGDVFSFLMKRDALSFREALRLVSRRVGMEIPEETAPRSPRRESETETLLRVNREAADFFHALLQRGPQGAPAREYLRRRGLSESMIVEFRLGYAPPAWDALLGHMTRRGIPPAVLEKTGLVVPRKDGSGFYDRFRNRVIFPICDLQSRIVGFGGRVIDDSTPKYLNSPETPVYRKREVLYGLDRARDACRAERSVFIVEGYLDLIALHQRGVRNAVATLGTALSAEHIQLVSRFADRLILVYDSDEAGQRSARRCIDLFWKVHADFRRGDVFREEQADTQILVLPEGHDPDSFVSRHGAEDFLKIARHRAMGIVSFLIEHAVRSHGLQTEGKIRIVNELVPALRRIDDPVAQAFYIQKLAERVGIDEAVVLARIKDAPNAGAGAAASPPPSVPAVDRMEERIVSLMVQFPEMLPEIARRKVVEELRDADLRTAARAILEFGLERTEQLPELLGRMEESPARRRLAALAFSEEPWTRKGCLHLITRFLEIRRLQDEADELQRAIEKAEREHNEAELRRLLMEKQNLARRRRQESRVSLHDQSREA
ncbi:MAG: DNA primase [Desulfobacterales bacterium]